MNTIAYAMAAIGIVAGLAVFLLAAAQLTCEHSASPVAQRITTVLFGMIGGYVAIDCWEALAGEDEVIEPMAIAFCITLTLSWGYRRFFRLRTTGGAHEA